jgi:beta-glucanase (GH16 family)
MVWNDEFDGPAGSPIDPARWTHEVGKARFNMELQTYTDAPDNVALDGTGNLVITATRQEGAMGEPLYFSGRINTQNKFATTYGRFEARMRLPSGQGLWPAFWLLGADIGEVGWPMCGEVDIMEESGGSPSTVRGSLHGPLYSGGNPLTTRYTLPSGSFADDFHVFAVEWEPNVMRWYVDDELYFLRIPSDVRSGGPWVFDHPFFIILNVAVGGTLPGNPDATTVFPQSLTVDYVRVWQQ